jgi:hypothetical protein
MNGGFMAHHGRWGMIVGSDTLLPPTSDGCAVAISGNAVEIRTFSLLSMAPADILALRQTPPCLVEHGHVSSALLGAEKPRPWGMSETGSLDIRRSALGLTNDGKTAIFAIGEWVTPRQLAETMLAAGAKDAAELDVNWSYTRFLLYGRGAEGDVTETLIPKTKHAPGLYVKRPSERDFFYLVRR